MQFSNDNEVEYPYWVTAFACSVVWAIGVVVLYFVAAFITYSTDPSGWGELTRLAFATAVTYYTYLVWDAAQDDDGLPE